MTKGSAPYGNWSYDAATDRLTGYGSDANGNMTSAQGMDGLAYDVENRLVSVPTSSNPEQYAYAPGNKRIWRRKPDGTEELYYYGISGQKLVTITPLVAANGDFFMTTLDTNLYFGSRTIVSRGVTVTLDRVGSNRAGGSRYFPYGEEQQVTAQDRDKFATYYRDSTTGLDYAQNRYYASTLGRFMSPDPYMATATSPSDPTKPQSWNRYAYVEGDPINYHDPSGLLLQPPEDDGEDDSDIGFQPQPTGPTRGSPVQTKPVIIGKLQKSGKQYDRVVATLDKIVSSIDPDCLSFLQSGGFNLKNYVSDLELYNLLAVANFAVGYAAITGTKGTNLPVGSAAIVVNLLSAFFSSSYTVDQTKLQGGTAVAQAFILIHELGHALSASGFQDDGPFAKNPNAGKENDRLVEKNCQKTLGQFQ